MTNSKNELPNINGASALWDQFSKISAINDLTNLKIPSSFLNSDGSLNRDLLTAEQIKKLETKHEKQLYQKREKEFYEENNINEDCCVACDSRFFGGNLIGVFSGFIIMVVMSPICYYFYQVLREDQVKMMVGLGSHLKTLQKMA